MTTWLGGILEVTSKVRYGLTSRGSPLYRFIPYDRRFSPLAVGCSIRDFSTNIHVVVEPSKEGKNGQMSHGNLVKTLGPPTQETEMEILLLTYAYDSNKHLRKHLTDTSIVKGIDNRYYVDGHTFHIDPPGCLDVDDAFTFFKTSNGWKVMIHIADVDYWIGYKSDVDIMAMKRSTSFYCPNGTALSSMLPDIYSSQEASLLPGDTKPALSLVFDWVPGKPILSVEWLPTRIKTDTTYTYESVMKDIDIDYIRALRELAVQLGGDMNDSHTWVEEMMIFYNEQAAIHLREKGRGVLRRHSAPNEARLKEIALLEEKGFEHLCMEAAEYCHATDENAYHYGLRKSFYSYASSPLRRYADLLNQRIIKDILKGTDTIANPTDEDIEYLNRRAKQAKSFSREIFFMRMLSDEKTGSIQGYVIQRKESSTKVWIPEWKYTITVKEVLPEKWYKISWYRNMELAGWKQRVVYSATPLTDTMAPEN